ncbi:TerC family protein [Thermomicrobiaceae bacterium CFH 74404]|uniref:TerC family protein n=1 Tax=Thermalbibacter longus TaxID=2951981 RepID=A0AA41WDG4_9BACT|nr:TerC family protein [Thermalbibacter longus]MCM8749078.1 TerC family protein [Thermalbibacter longus]
MTVPLWAWILFVAVILVLLAIDLGVFHRRAHAVSMKEAGIWVSVWVTLSLLFGIGVWLVRGSEPGLQFFTGYLIELSLSADNMFVFVLIFTAFAVPAAYQHRVLFYGILGALVMRAAMILGGAWLIEQFHWILYLFGAFLVFTGIRMALEREEKEVDVENNIAIRLVSRFAPIVPQYRGEHFLVREGGRLFATPLLVVLVLVELTDLAFAVDSIPAIFAVTQDPFIVFTSNVFAILGLRSMYFLLANLVQRLVYLRLGLAVILTFIGVKMLIADFYKVPTLLSLGVVITTLLITIVASLIVAERRGVARSVAEAAAAARERPHAPTSEPGS